MLLKEILRNVNCKWVQGKNPEIEDIVIDSRKVKYGSLFVCLKGLKSDGHQYVKQAANAGAAAVLAQEAITNPPDNITIAQTDNTRAALALCAEAFFNYPADSFNLVGITGTKGKTTSTYLMENVLAHYRHRVGVIGTLGAKVAGVPLNIHYDTSTTPDPVELQHILSVMRDDHVNDVVMEVSSQALSFDKVEGMMFNIGLFTNLTQDHLDFHKTMEDYMRAKSKMFKQCRQGVINADSDAGLEIIKIHKRAQSACTFTTFSIERPSELRAININYPENGVSFCVEINGCTENFFVPIKGRFTVYNALGVIGAALIMGIPVEVIKQGLAVIKGVPGRIQDVPNDKGRHVIVDYAHSPDSLVNIINAVREFTKGRVMVVFGCGGDRDALKRPMMGKIAGELADFCIVTSDNPRTENPMDIIAAIEGGIKETNCPHETISDRREAIFRAVKLAEPTDTLIIAGKGHENYQIIGEATIHFDDLEVAQEALEAL
ncbi:MAG: UDP-N-acetylmuramoyl-L-alanyl-D-glutamate--2,6-diaminopimelate ligase [Clostridiales bacterium]|jgi:UDP-N-acetylmuramoyl-L-alanyl-D-glutamate--2,6-diaminopimelate ligase|nr:UDP-N-acetylmuramoyl-L-alanyl-D-glutamate--2,6-diaminopimelate ligase [Clostridiales bacterium]